MFKLSRQAGNLLFLCLLACASPAWAEAADKGGPTGAGGDRVLSVGSLISSLVGGDSSSKEESKQPKEPDAIKAKRLDQEGEAENAKEEKPPAPYKVYPSPVIMEEAPTVADPYERAREKAASSSLSGWGRGEARTFDPSRPPPLPDALRGPEKPKTSPPVKTGPVEVPPISALPKQFFPILPAGSLSDGQPQLLPVASNKPLESDHGDITRAIIVIHDRQRNAADGVATLMTLSGEEGSSSLILAPQFSLELDVARFAAHLPDEGRNIARWSVEDGWQTGAESLAPGSRGGISSFTAVDLLLMFLADRQRFPSLTQVVLAGHGMGGDFVQRYAALGQAPDILRQEGVGVRFLVANPSSYLYFTGLRPAPEGPAFALPDAKACPGVNAYPYGLDSLNAYGRRAGKGAIRLRYPERAVAYLVGDKIVSDTYLDQSCPAAAQGADRLSRGRHYARHLTQSFGPSLGRGQFFVFVPNAGYDPVSLYASSCGVETLFGAGECGQ